MNLKLAYCAGHYLQTPGKRLPAALDPAQTREWRLNDRVARQLAQAARAYPQLELLRTDDPTGQRFIDIPERVAMANQWGADLYLDLHHNAAGRIFDGGGVEVYSFPGSTQGKRYRDAIYQAVVEAGGLRGNRSNPLLEARFDSLRLTAMPAVLIEYGYMDSTADAPVILTEDYARRVGQATVEAVAALHGLKKQVYGYPLEQFIREVQAALGARVDGIAGPETFSKTVTVSEQKNRTHPVVKPLQKRLAALGYNEVGAPDGVAGPLFTAALVAYQEDHRCWVDGEITAGNKTWKTLLGM